jgi:hypothetical protein
MRARLQSPALRLAAAFATALLACACGAVKHGYSAGDIAGQTLATDMLTGAERLQMEIDYDPAVRDFVTAHGRPDYLHVLDRNILYLFYPEEDLVAVIKRDRIPPGEVLTYPRIPGHFFRLLPEAEVTSIQAKRGPRHRTSARRTRRAAAPAAPAPASKDTGLRITGFDLDTLVERFREPLSAADSGVSGWRAATLADGTHARVARSGNTEFRVQPDAVIAATSIPSHARTTPPEAHVGYLRVNRVVFGTRAYAISQSLEPLVAKVTADPSGKTRIVRRVAGRTVSVIRDTRRRLLFYRVHAD